MDIDADDVVGALPGRLICIRVWRDDLIVADPFTKLASWQTRVTPALLINVLRDVHNYNYSTRWAL